MNEWWGLSQPSLVAAAPTAWQVCRFKITVKKWFTDNQMKFQETSTLLQDLNLHVYIPHMAFKLSCLSLLLHLTCLWSLPLLCLPLSCCISLNPPQVALNYQPQTPNCGRVSQEVGGVVNTGFRFPGHRDYRSQKCSRAMDCGSTMTIILLDTLMAQHMGGQGVLLMGQLFAVCVIPITLWNMHLSSLLREL